MIKDEKIALVKEINRHISANAATIWPGFTAFPYILYDDANQIASGGTNWPERYTQKQTDIWVADGNDPQLMGNTSICYHGVQVAIWDTRTWPETPTISMAAGSIAHEMFHVFQQANMEPLWPNELLLPQYPHSAHSVALVLAENKQLTGILAHPDEETIGRCLKKIAALRKQREAEIGEDFFAYDKRCESLEGTAAYVEIRMRAIVEGKTPVETLEDSMSYLPLLIDNSRLLVNYRQRCYAAGLILCLAADVLMSGWQRNWAKSGCNLYDWMMCQLTCTSADSKTNAASQADTGTDTDTDTDTGISANINTGISTNANANTNTNTNANTNANANTNTNTNANANAYTNANLNPYDLAMAGEYLSTFRQEQENRINAFLAQPFTILEGDIQLLAFDPMNLTCAGGLCLHVHGKLRYNGNEQMMETPFLAEYGDTILAIKKIYLPKTTAAATV